MLEIKTGKYAKSKTIQVDGRTWTMTILGAGDELRMSQAQRRIQQLEAKIKAGTAVDADYDKYDALENAMYKTFKEMFKDETPDNKYVNEWIDSTPLAYIQKTIEDIKEQVKQKEADKAENGQNHPAPTAN